MNFIKISVLLLTLTNLFAGKLLEAAENIENMCGEVNGATQCTKIPIIETSSTPQTPQEEGSEVTNKQKKPCVNYKFSVTQSNILNLIEKHQRFFLLEEKSSLLKFKNDQPNEGEEDACEGGNSGEKNFSEKGGEYKIKVMNTMPEFEEIPQNEVQIFNLNVLNQQIRLSDILTFFENKSVEFKLRQVFFIPQQVEMHPKIMKLLNPEKEILKLFQEKKEGGDCILFLQYSESQFDYFFLPVTLDFHFEYTEMKLQNDINQLNHLQQSIKRAQRTFMLSLPGNLMTIHNQHCAIHSFGFIASFKPFVTYTHLGYILCAQTIFDAMFGLEDYSQNFNLKAFTYEDILLASEEPHNMEANGSKRFTYQSIVQVKQITAYLSVILQDQITALIKSEQKTQQEQHSKGEKEKVLNSKHQYSLFKIISAFDHNTKLSVYKIQTFEEILEENFSHNAPILKSTLEFISVIEEGEASQAFPAKFQSFQKVLDESEGYAFLVKQTNQLILWIDKLNKLWYGLLKYLINLY